MESNGTFRVHHGDKAVDSTNPGFPIGFVFIWRKHATARRRVMLKFKQLRNLAFEIESWTGGVRPDHLMVLEALEGDVTIDSSGAHPAEIIEVVHVLLKTSQSDTIAGRIIFALLDDWLLRQKNPS